jgi:hypothetical protein
VGREKEFFLTQIFILFGPYMDWVRPTHIREGNLFYSVLYSHVDLSLASETSRIIFGHLVALQVNT